MKPYLPLGGRVLAVKIVFGIIAALSVIGAVSTAFEVALLDRMAAGEVVGARTLDFNDIRQAIVFLLQFLALIAGAVVFIMWLFRAYGNIDAVNRGGRRYDQGWAIGAWFVPILNLFRPVQMVNDVTHTARMSGRTVVGVWWALWVISSVLERIGSRDTDTPEAARDASLTLVVGDVLNFAAAILAIVVVVKASRGMDQRAAEVQRRPAPASPQPAREPWPEPAPGSRQPSYPG